MLARFLLLSHSVAMSKTSQTIDPISGKPLLAPTPAATIIVVHENENGPPEFLMVERSGKMAFAAGAAVFPGGRVDPGDYVLAKKFLSRNADAQHDDEILQDMAGRIAAIRETVEEAGYPVAMAEPASPEAINAIRAEASGESDFAANAERFGLLLQPETLTYFARWRPPFNEARIFDTRFYLARATLDKASAIVDATENRKLFWASATQVLERADRGELKIIFPTRRNLEKLAQCSSYAELVEHAQKYPAQLIIPFVEERGGETHLCVPDNMGYPITSEPIKGALRG